MSASVTNIFEIENPEVYECTVWRFQIAHSELLLNVHLPDGFMSESNHYFLLFQGIEYFEGPIRWDSANFVIASDEECLALYELIQTKRQNEYSQKLLADKPMTSPKELHAGLVEEYIRLYKVQMPGYEIKILAGKNSVKKFDYKNAPKHWLGSMGNISQ